MSAAFKILPETKWTKWSLFFLGIRVTFDIIIEKVREYEIAYLIFSSIWSVFDRLCNVCMHFIVMTFQLVKVIVILIAILIVYQGRLFSPSTRAKQGFRALALKVLKFFVIWIHHTVFSYNFWKRSIILNLHGSRVWLTKPKVNRTSVFSFLAEMYEISND